MTHTTHLDQRTNESVIIEPYQLQTINQSPVIMEQLEGSFEYVIV